MTKTNRLAREKSPYLLQHAKNPVDWFAWGEQAFVKAREENKPIFLSIGYSTCHWCHVMAHESFENEATAAIMNREFVNIKVDREERPDVDRVYMTFVQATTGHGGWPMSVWLTPDLQPFIGGTYFPPEDRYGHAGFPGVLEKIAAAWKENGKRIREQGTKIVEALRESQQAQCDHTHKIDIGILDTAFEQLSGIFDETEGGFGSAPKFPRAVTFNFLTRYYARKSGFGNSPTHRKSDPDHRQAAEATAKRALKMNLFTLGKMAAGGIYDHLGGGFHRYSVDRYWHVPHFEKMLYDQAQLANAYIDAFQLTQDRQFEAVAFDILDYVAREMTSKDGGFFSAEDADSEEAVAAVYDRRDNEGVSAHRAPLQKSEGAFYVWTEKEIDKALGEQAEIFKLRYGVEPKGNAPQGSDPQGEFRDKNILIERRSIAEIAEQFSKSRDEIQQSLAGSRKTLFALRSKRPRPHLDDKIISAWNGLMISAFARAAQVFAEPRYAEQATRAANFLRTQLWDGNLLFRSYREGRGAVEGFADDYAFVIQGLLDLYEASFDIEWLKFAIDLQETIDRLFFDEKNGGYYSTSGRDSSVFLRMKEDNDGAEPAASSVAVLNLLRLSQIYNRTDWRKRSERTIEAFSAALSHFPSAMPQMLVGFDHSLGKSKQIVIAGERNSAETKALLAEVHRHFLPDKVLLLADGGAAQKYLGETNEAIGSMTPIKGKAAAYVCENFSCQAPVTDVKALGMLLRQNRQD